jgi:hypothetical protein
MQSQELSAEYTAYGDWASIFLDFYHSCCQSHTLDSCKPVKPGSLPRTTCSPLDNYLDFDHGFSSLIAIAVETDPPCKSHKFGYPQVTNVNANIVIDTGNPSKKID